MKKRLLIPLVFLATGATTASLLHAQAQSSWVFFGPDGRLQYHTDSRGNRIMDFSYAGYRGGGVALPNAPARTTVTPASGDNTARIQAAIDSVAQRTPDANGLRGAVVLAAGRFDVSGTLNITTSGVVLRGSGSGTSGTLLNMTGAPHLLLSVKGSGTWQTSGATATFTDGFVPSGALSVHVNSASGFSAGDTVLVSRPVTQDWVHLMSMDDLVRNGQPQTWLAAGTSINTDRTIARISGTQVTFDAPLTDSFDGAVLDPPGGSLVKYSFPGRIAEVGLEHLRIKAPAQDSDIANPQFQALSMDAVINGWVRDLVIQDTDNTISVGGASKQVTLDSVTVTHSLAFTHSAGPADFSAAGTRILFNKCASKGNTGVWAFVSQARVTGPVVLLNCNADARGFAPHQRWGTGLLADSCQFPGGTSSTPGIAYSDRGNFGSGQGWDAGWAVAWNATSPNFVVQEAPGAHNWCIGCVGKETSATEPGGSSTALPNGIYDSLGTHVTPASLYLAQLKDRLGNAAIANIAYGDFALAASADSRSVIAGGEASDAVSVTPSGVFGDSVALQVSGLPAGATASFSPPSLASGSSTLRVTTTGTTPPGSVALTVTGTSGNLSHTAHLTLDVWKDLDVGAPGVAGSATVSGSTFNVKGSGGDIWKTSDQFHYVLEPAAGDRTITARVATQQNTNVWAKAGVMIRETADAGSSYVFVMVTPGNGVNIQYRPSAGASSVSLVKRTGVAAPSWVRLVRAGGTFTGFTSSDGTTWSQLGSIAVSMASNATAGLAVCAHDNTVINTSTFDSVSLR